MNSSFWRVPTLTVLATLLAVAGSVQGTEAGNWQGFVSLTPVYQGNADLDRGGDFSVGGAILRGGVAKDLGGGNRAGVTLTYDYLGYSFSNSGAFGRVEPWGIVQRYGVSAPLSFEVGDGWSVGVVPSVDWFKENGADTGDSLTWGATLSGSRRFEGGNRLGFGVGVFDGIEKTSVFPFLVVDWRFGDRWRLINPLPSGPTGPAGLELDYRFDGGWTAGVGVAYRVLRFRLNETGPTRNGVGEESGVPVFVRVTRNFTDQMALHLYGGVVAGGKLRVENSSGHKLSEEDFDPAPLVGATFVGRF
ncbi:MAG: hypothetical protein IPJ27_15620 [Candidatus Accumulibacter sp.]|uniref:Transporter n=1 Tax=Candidatus Accumulibacter proximus TaxID=2954385 RepID=A0A935UHZ7_9PROT|nr:hypothetical protein [Candidatus Accumulibacter proximus]